MNFIETSISYLIYPQDQELNTHKEVNDQEIYENTISSPINSQIYSLTLPENTKIYPLDVSMLNENRFNNTDSDTSDATIANSIEYQKYEPDTLSPSKGYNDNTNSDSFPSSPSSSFQDKNQETEEYHPSKPISNTRTRWTREEEDILISLVEKAGARRWNQIAAVLKTKTAKQCRDHYANCLDPGIKNSLWTVEEERILLMKYQEYGSHWSGIKKFLPGRTTSMIKNYITMLLKKNERGLSHEFQKSGSFLEHNYQNDENNSSCNSNESDNDDHNFSLSMTNTQEKYNNFSCLNINCLLNRPHNAMQNLFE